jgi:hypothetical protein
MTMDALARPALDEGTGPVGVFHCARTMCLHRAVSIATITSDMAKWWEYSRGRHVAMQITMWVVLALTLGLAALVAQSKRDNMKVPLGSPTQVGLLLVRMPADWHCTLSHDDARLLLTAYEPGGVDSRSGRTIQISEDLLRGPAPPAIDYLSSAFPTQDVHVQRIFFDGLNQTGVMTQVPPDDDAAPAPSDIEPGLYACAVTPVLKNRSLAITVSMGETPPLTPGDYDLFHQVISAIALSPK